MTEVPGTPTVGTVVPGVVWGVPQVAAGVAPSDIFGSVGGGSALNCDPVPLGGAYRGFVGVLIHS
jgi:hypothetical protein